MTNTISASNLERNFLELSKSELATGTLVARDLAIDNAFLAINSSHDFLFIIRDSHGTSSPSKRLKLLNVDYVIRLTADFGDKQITDNFTVVTLPNSNSELLFAFCTLLSVLLTNDVTQDTDAAKLREVVETLVEMFTPRYGIVRDRAKGLFGELSVIKFSKSPDEMVNAWHDSTTANKDFSLADKYIEVKTTEGLIRKHEIAVSQLLTDNTARPIYLASVLLEEDPNGQSVMELFKDIRVLVTNSDLQIKLAQQVMETIGLDAEYFDELKFSIPGGHNGIWIFNANELPRPVVDPGTPLSQAISGIRFAINVDLLDSHGITHSYL